MAAWYGTDGNTTNQIGDADFSELLVIKSIIVMKAKRDEGHKEAGSEIVAATIVVMDANQENIRAYIHYSY